MEDVGRVWIFGFRDQLSESEENGLGERLKSFLAGWSAHRVPVDSDFEIRYRRFLLIFARDEVSGCAIDELFRTVRRAAVELGAELSTNDLIMYRTVDGIALASRDEFRALARQGVITERTVVFDNTVDSRSALNRWEVPVRDAWHRDLLTEERRPREQ